MNKIRIAIVIAIVVVSTIVFNGLKPKISSAIESKNTQIENIISDLE